MKRAILTAALLLALPFSASAVIGVDSTGKTTGAVVYAKETLSKSSTIEKDGETYYLVSESSRTGALAEQRQLELDVRIQTPFTRPENSSTVIQLDLEDMVFARAMSNFSGGGSPVLAEFQIRSTLVVAQTDLTYTLLQGGQRGDSSMTVGITTNSIGAIGITDVLYISFRSLGILPDTPGTIRVTFSYEYEGIRIAKSYELRDAVKAMKLLEVSSTANNATVDVDSDDLTKFQTGGNVRDDGLAANVGKVTADAATTFTALDPFVAPYIHLAGNRVLAADGTWIVSPSRSVPASRRTSGTLPSILGSTASIAIEGETDFLGDDGKVFVSSSADCSPTADSLVEDDGITAPLSSFSGEGGYVCIEVDGETPITETMPYRATVRHESATAAFPLPESEQVLGSIGFGGATVRIPYLTTDTRYNQRIVAVNRSGRPAGYTLTFQPSEDTIATPEDAATGTFPTGRTVLQVRDVVTLDDGTDEGSGHTAATLSVLAPPAQLDVATVQTNRNDGSTDSVVYDVE